MRTTMRRAGTVAALSTGLLVIGAGGAFAHECTNASRNLHNPGAGVQLVIDGNTEEPVWISKGLQMRLEKGVVDFETGAGFHGLVGIDVDGDGKADVSTWLVGREGEVPETAQENGAACHGVVNIDDYVSCLGL